MFTRDISYLTPKRININIAPTDVAINLVLEKVRMEKPFNKEWILDRANWWDHTNFYYLSYNSPSYLIRWAYQSLFLSDRKLN